MLEYSDNYVDTSGSLWQFKREKLNINNGDPADVTTNDSTSFKYKSRFLGNLAADGVLRNGKIVAPLRYLSNLCRSLEMSLINCKIHLELNWFKNCVMSNIAGETTFKITNTKLYVLIVTLATKDNVSLTKQLNEGFKRPVYWYDYKTKIGSRNLDDNNPARFYLDAFFQGVKRLFVLAFNNTAVDVTNTPINNTYNRVERDSHKHN